MTERPGVRRYECSLCRREFGKAEHLRRHERTHTGSRPFVCSECKSEFARQDALVRHEKRYNHVRRRSSAQSPLMTSSASGISQNSTLTDSTMDGVMDAGIPISATDTMPNAQFNLPTPTITNPVSATDFSDDQFLQLNWPDAEGLLQSILSSDLSTLPPFDVFPSQPIVQNIQLLDDQSVSPWLTTDDIQPATHGGASAVRNLSQIINNVSADVTIEAQTTGFTTIFLDGCLHMFFTHFVPSFPVVHAPTFVFKDWTHPLLLNAIALGSLFMGQQDDIKKGEILWRLAHTAVTTSWHDLIKHKGPYDSCRGVQLVLTALLGQVYATLSENVTLRKTAQIFHSLGFYWAREVKMYDVDFKTLATPPDAYDDANILADKWKRWAACETQLRALLGHYVLDGQIAQNTGGPTCQRHTSNPLPVSCDERLFDAPLAQEWALRMRDANRDRSTFRACFNVMFDRSQRRDSIQPALTLLSSSVLLEGLKSLVSERNESPLETVGLPCEDAIMRALSCLHRRLDDSSMLSSFERLEARLRWHAISMDCAVDMAWLCRTLCYSNHIEQRVFGGKKPTANFQITEWNRTRNARRALLHALAIGEIVQQLPLGRTNAMHIPNAIFAAAITYSGFLIAGTSTMIVPRNPDWDMVMTSDSTLVLSADSGENLNDVLRYLKCLVPLEGKMHNLFYDMRHLCTTLQNFTRPWGVTKGMCQVLNQLQNLCSQRVG